MNRPGVRIAEAEAETVAAEMRTGLDVLNDVHPALASTLSSGFYDVRVVRADTLPSCIARLAPWGWPEDAWFVPSRKGERAPAL